MAEMIDTVELSIVIATIGRGTLRASIESATSQMIPGDELLIVFDDSGDAGDTPRNRVLASLHGTHVVFLDDDDELAPGALDLVRAFARDYPGRWGLFQLDVGPSGIVWKRSGMHLMAAATGMCVVPNIPDRLGRFGRVPGAPPGRLGDYPFLVESAAMLGPPVWCEEIIQLRRPEKNRLKLLRYRLKLGTRLRRVLGRDEPDPAPERRYPEAEAWAVERTRELRARLGAEAPSVDDGEPEIWRA
jgi:hypothetical protein